MDGSLESEHSRDMEVTNYAVVRAAGIGDLDDIVRLAMLQEQELKASSSSRIIPSHDDLRKLYRERLENSDKNFNYEILVALQDGRIVGYVFGKVPLNRVSPFYALLQGIYVVSEVRGNGISDLLTERISTFARESGANSIKGDVYIGSVGEAYFGKKGWKRESLTSGLVRLAYDL